jgi:predicted outer membrane repeat protein
VARQTGPRAGHAAEAIATASARGAIFNGVDTTADTWYVDPSGDDAWDCQSPAHTPSSTQGPCRTIGSAVAKAHPGDTISIAAGFYTELLNLDSALTLFGAGAAGTIVDGNHGGTVVTVAAGGAITLMGVTVENGSSHSGGGIANAGVLTVTNSNVTGNTASHEGGGGIYNTGTLTVVASTISGNTSLRQRRRWRWHLQRRRRPQPDQQHGWQQHGPHTGGRRLQ